MLRTRTGVAHPHCDLKRKSFWPSRCWSQMLWEALAFFKLLHKCSSKFSPLLRAKLWCCWHPPITDSTMEWRRAGLLRNIVLCCCRGQLIRDLQSLLRPCHIKTDAGCGAGWSCWWQVILLALLSSLLSTMAASPVFSPGDTCCFHRFLLSARNSRVSVSYISYLYRLHIHVSLKRSRGRPLSLAPVVASSP